VYGEGLLDNRPEQSLKKGRLRFVRGLGFSRFEAVYYGDPLSLVSLVGLVGLMSSKSILISGFASEKLHFRGMIQSNFSGTILFYISQRT